MAAIYDYETGDTITLGLQGSAVSDEAAHTAASIATDRNTAVVLEDDDGVWYYGPEGTVRLLTREERVNMGYPPNEADAL